MVWLACHPQGPLTTRQIASATQVPAGYLAKVLQPLGRAQLVVSRRGVNGGFVLARSPEQINLLQVIHAVEPDEHQARAGRREPSNGQPTTLSRKLDRAMSFVEETLRHRTIADLAADVSDDADQDPDQ